MKLQLSPLSPLVMLSAALVLTATASAKHTPSHGGVAPADKKFMMEAAQGGMAEVKLGQLAARRAASANVKQFGMQMAADHSKASAELMQLAKQKGVKLPKSMGSTHQAAATHLMKLHGAAFDKAYMSHMVEDHEMDVQAFRKASNMSQDSDLKAWSGKTLPTLEEHLRMSKEIASQVGAK